MRVPPSARALLPALLLMAGTAHAATDLSVGSGSGPAGTSVTLPVSLAGDDFVAFERIGDDRTLVVVNRSASPVTLPTDLAWARIEYGDGRTEANSVTVAPRSAIVVSGGRQV